MKNRWARYILAAGLVLGVATLSHATTHEFYKGKTVRLVVGTAPGGGFDTYSRAIARHMGRQIPGNPTIIVENMPGAGQLVAANHVYKVAKPDGLTMGNFGGGLFVQQVLGRPGVEFDGLKFEFVGAPVRESSTCALTKASGITSMEKWMASKAPVKLGSTAPGGTTYDHSKILQAALGLPIHLVAGYKGTAEVRLAAESGEVEGACGFTWDSVKATWTKGLETGDAVVVLQVLPKPHPELPKVPLAIDFAKTEEGRQLIQAGIHDMNVILRPYALPPGTPKERVQLFRKAFVDTMKDPEFLADARKSKLDIDAVTGEELERTVHGLFKLDPKVVAQLKEIIK